MASKRFYIHDNFSIDRGWLLFEGISINIDSIAFITVCRNPDDQRRQLEREENKDDLKNNYYVCGVFLAIFSAFIFSYSAKPIVVNYFYLTNKIDFLIFLSFLIVTFLPVLALGRLMFKNKNYSPLYELLIETSSNMELFFTSYDIDYLYKIKETIEKAIMSDDSKPSYHFNISAKTIEKIDANVTHVTDSPGAAVIGGSASHVQQNTNVVVQSIQDLTRLAEILANSNNAYKGQMEEIINELRAHLSNGDTRSPEAKSAWEKFTQYVGTFANTGNEVWTLVGRISNLFV